jgi:hypothetical protein
VWARVNRRSIQMSKLCNLAAVLAFVEYAPGCPKDAYLASVPVRTKVV